MNAIERLRDLSEQAQWKCSEDPSCPDCAADTEAVAAVDALYQAAAIVNREIQSDLPLKCLICAVRDGDHLDECPVPALAAAVRRIDGDAA